MIIHELDRVALTVDLPDWQLQVGDMGTVVDITSNGEEYTVEFFTLEGETFAIVPVLPDQVRHVDSGEIANA